MRIALYQNIKVEREEEIASKIYDSANAILTNYERIDADECILMDGCIDILDWLREKDIPLGICTSNSQRSAETARAISD